MGRGNRLRGLGRPCPGPLGLPPLPSDCRHGGLPAEQRVQQRRGLSPQVPLRSQPGGVLQPEAHQDPRAHPPVHGRAVRAPSPSTPSPGPGPASLTRSTLGFPLVRPCLGSCRLWPEAPPARSPSAADSQPPDLPVSGRQGLSQGWLLPVRLLPSGRCDSIRSSWTLGHTLFFFFKNINAYVHEQLNISVIRVHKFS